MRARGNVAAGQDESTIVQFDEVAELSCARLGADHYEDGRGGDLSRWPVRTCSSARASRRAWPWPSATRGAEPDFDVWGRLQLGDEVVGHAGGQRLAPYEQRDPGRRILARCRAA